MPQQVRIVHGECHRQQEVGRARLTEDMLSDSYAKLGLSEPPEIMHERNGAPYLKSGEAHLSVSHDDPRPDESRRWVCPPGGSIDVRRAGDTRVRPLGRRL